MEFAQVPARTSFWLALPMQGIKNLTYSQTRAPRSWADEQPSQVQGEVPALSPGFLLWMNW